MIPDTLALSSWLPCVSPYPITSSSALSVHSAAISRPGGFTSIASTKVTSLFKDALKSKGFFLQALFIQKYDLSIRNLGRVTNATSGVADAQSIAVTRAMDTNRSDEATSPWAESTVVGILGGGQLGRMLCEAASSLGIRVKVLDPLSNAPAATVAGEHVVGSFTDAATIREFAKGCSVLTVEIEHVDVASLEALEKEGLPIHPSPSTLAVIQDKFAQKVHFRHHGVPLPDFMAIDSGEDADKAGRVFGFPLMLKSRRLAYDGRGNAVARTPADVAGAIETLGGVSRGLYAEKWVPFVKELAIMVTRERSGSLASYPVVETTHKDNICLFVEAPAVVPSVIAEKARIAAETAVQSLGGAGVFGVELFLMADGEVLLNEIAPRPHNSGHYTIEACATSQYEQHLRAVLGRPLGDAGLKVPAAAMYNILGQAEGAEGFAAAAELMEAALRVPGASVHWYAKKEVKAQRKMGHITVVGPSTQVVRERMALITAGQPVESQFSKLGGKDAAREAGPPSADQGTRGEAREGAASGSRISEAADPSRPLVGVIMGSDSDLGVMKAAAEALDSFGVPHEVTVVSAHRTPERMVEYAKQAHQRGIQVIIAGAGGAAHLPGMVAALTPLPVIGVPVRATVLDGVDSLLSIVQMPRGVPVATVAINNAMNAGLLAVRILGAADATLRDRVLAYQEEMRTSVEEKAKRLERIGWKEYLEK
eukprot:TRINITY_DN2815_c0_g1_i1.p1 TRINITY_DN2815_c0_g1~~TRINITY_DN2815_c0_g1_i1.p1  ORF type:complete len:709 (-),score=130.79 TRINITY_DN2815_c0_g1_i1:480-2606(-)